MKFLHFSIVLAIIACMPICARADGASSSVPSAVTSQVKSIQIELQPWQQRRKEFAKTVQGLRERNQTAQKDFDAILTEFETKLLSRTPMENMEILGVFYVPKDGIEKCFPVIIQNTVLGWYDALRFASASGRAEILNNEGFFKKAFVISGSESGAKAVKFIESNPERVAQLLKQGFSFAEKFRETSNYDRRWPTAYGLERIICAQGGSCITPPSIPKEQWDKAWDEAKQRVSSYYQPGKPTTASGSSTQRSQ